MKSFAGFSLVLIGCSLLSSVVATSILDNVASPEARLELTQQFLKQFLLHFNGVRPKTDLKFPGMAIEDISFPVLPDLPDPLALNDTENVIPDEDGASFYGFFNNWNSQIVGLSNVVDLVTVGTTPEPLYEFLINYQINAASEIVISGEHLANLTIDSEDIFANILSSGDFSFGFSNASIGLTVQVKLLLSNGLSITSAALDLDIGTVRGSTTETIIEGEPIVWEEFSEQLTGLFPQIWEMAKPQVDAIVEFALSVLLEECRLTDLINGNLDCITGGDEE